MISKQTLEAAFSLMPIVDADSTALSTVADTPLHDIQRLTAGPLALNGNNGEVEDYILGSELAELSRGRNPMGIPEHDLTIEEIAPVVGQAVGAVMSIARNDVNPMIARIVEGVQKEMDIDGELDDIPVSIVPQYDSAIWTNPMLWDMVRQYEETIDPISDIRRRPDYGNVDVDLVALLNTGIKDIDDDINKLIERLGGTQVLTDIFITYYGASNNLTLQEQIQFDEMDSPIRLILLYMMTIGLRDQPPEVDLSLDEHRTYTTVLAASVGRVIARRIVALDKAVAQKKLVIRMPSEDVVSEMRGAGELCKILVNQRVYVKWLEEGGSPEVLLGSVMTDRNVVYQSLLEQSERYRKEWARYERIIRLNRRNRTFNQLQSYIGAAVAKEINDVDLDTVPHDRATMHADLSKHVSHMCSDDVDNLYVTVRHILCNTIFKHTDCLRILTEFDRLADSEISNDPMEIAFIVQVNYTTDWVAEMILRKTMEG